MRAVTACCSHGRGQPAQPQPRALRRLPNNAAISGTSNTVPTARATTEQNASSAKPIGLARWSFGTRAIQVRIIGCRHCAGDRATRLPLVIQPSSSASARGKQLLVGAAFDDPTMIEARRWSARVMVCSRWAITSSAVESAG